MLINKYFDYLSKFPYNKTQYINNCEWYTNPLKLDAKKNVSFSNADYVKTSPN